MKILIIGGTDFVGRLMSQAALDRGHDLTLFHRGKTNADLFPAAEHIFGDRDGEVAKLADRKWDAVIDVCGYVPRVVKQSVKILKDAVDQYVFISTISVYKDEDKDKTTEESPVKDKLDDPSTEEINKYTYGPLKVFCEREVEEVFGDKSLMIRPGFIIGPHDSTDRFTYWVRKIGTRKQVLCPDAGDQPFQAIDVRDLGDWTIKLVEDKVSGVINVTGPENEILFTDMLQFIKTTLGSPTELIFCPETFLEDEGVRAVRELPFWLPRSKMSHQMLRTDISKALDHGLKLRPLAETIRDTFNWDQHREVDELSVGMSLDRESELIKKCTSKPD